SLMAGDTLRGIGKKAIAEALESSSEAAPERTTESNGSVQAGDATADIDIEEGRPVRSAAVDPSVTLLGGLAAAPVPIAPDIAPDLAPDLAPDPAHDP